MSNLKCKNAGIYDDFMSDHGQWLINLGGAANGSAVDGLVLVKGYQREGRPPEEVVMMEKAKNYGAHAVFFEAGRNGRSPVAQAFIFISDGPADDPGFGELHKRLWSWGGVPLIYRKTPGLVQLFRCAHNHDFVSRKGEIICNPVKTLKIAAAISNSDAWWDASRLRNGTLWDDPAICKTMLSAGKAAHKQLINEVKQLNDDLNNGGILKPHLRRKLLILSLLIAYLEERGVFSPDYFGQFLGGATKFFQVLADGTALIGLLADLEERFNGHVFILDNADRESLGNSTQLTRFARLVEGRQEKGGQLTLWKLYSFKDLPVELISHIYQLFVKNVDGSVYTPPFLVRLMLDEVLSWERLDRLQQKSEIIIDVSCGSGVFLVEAYKRLVLHWRSRNDWKKPGVAVLKGLLQKVHGIDLDAGAVELTAFSLCLALCDALEPETIRATKPKLFPLLAGRTLHHSCFFAAKEQGLVKERIGVVVGNPPFGSSLTTDGAKRSYHRYEEKYGSLPDKQLAYLFLHEAIGMVAEGGVLAMLQQYNFLYNQQSLAFRRSFLTIWDVREVLDFISVRGLFQKGDADTKVVVVVTEAVSPPMDRNILHATFRRSGRADAEQGFDIDYYDLHWLPRQLVLVNDGVWRTDLLGGGRVLGFVDRLKTFRALGEYAAKPGWDVGEGFIAAKRGLLVEAPHITGKPLLEPKHLKETSRLTGLKTVTTKRFKSAYTPSRFQAPMVLIHEHEDLMARCFLTGYYAYKNKIAGFCAPRNEAIQIQAIAAWLNKTAKPLQAFVSASGMTTFTQRSKWVDLHDIKALPYPESGSLNLSPNERILVDDIVDYYRDLIRLGEDSTAMNESGHAALPDFNTVFTRQINTIYKKKPLHTLEAQTWPGVICQPFAFGKCKLDWKGADELKSKLASLLHEQKGATLHITRISRIYDGNFIFLLKPDRLRYWLRSVALRDADETLADLRDQGF
jgi:hypothetical protein